MAVTSFGGAGWHSGGPVPGSAGLGRPPAGGALREPEAPARGRPKPASCNVHGYYSILSRADAITFTKC